MSAPSEEPTVKCFPVTITDSSANLPLPDIYYMQVVFLAVWFSYNPLMCQANSYFCKYLLVWSRLPCLPLLYLISESNSNLTQFSVNIIVRVYHFWNCCNQFMKQFLTKWLYFVCFVCISQLLCAVSFLLTKTVSMCLFQRGVLALTLQKALHRHWFDWIPQLENNRI